jgi:hypothetical protein
MIVVVALVRSLGANEWRLISYAMAIGYLAALVTWHP